MFVKLGSAAIFVSLVSVSSVMSVYPDPTLLSFENHIYPSYFVNANVGPIIVWPSLRAATSQNSN